MNLVNLVNLGTTRLIIGQKYDGGIKNLLIYSGHKIPTFHRMNKGKVVKK